ncbi:polysaccharide biosynthesis/export family protein [Akkermansiaceae bacterium]|nr:polysaccharide biosynthesis/export family protein [Akkermansiaceae bacterium]
MKTISLRSIVTCLFGFIALAAPTLAQIEAGTSVQITIMGVPVEEKGKIDAMYPVSESGTVNLPFIGTVRAAGMRPETLAASIQSAYKSAQIYNNPTIQVISTREGAGVQEQMVHVGGQVRRTGPVNYQKNLTIYQAVQAAGGATEFGSLRRVKLYRNGKTQTYDLTNPQFMRVPLEPDDTLEVPQKDWLGR